MEGLRKPKVLRRISDEEKIDIQEKHTHDEDKLMEEWSEADGVSLVHDAKQ